MAGKEVQEELDLDWMLSDAGRERFLMYEKLFEEYPMPFPMAPHTLADSLLRADAARRFQQEHETKR